MPAFTRQDYTIHYTLEGSPSAPLLVFSNSLGAELTMWDRQAAEFSRRFRVLRYDNRGHGHSTAPKGPYALPDVANDAAQLLDHLGETSAYFCGLSLGGMVGMWLSTHRSELISKLVLCNTSAQLGPKENWDSRIAAVQKGGMQAVVKPVMERWFTEKFRAKSPDVVARIEQSFLRVSEEGYIGCCTAIRDMDLRPKLPQINMSTLVIAGTYDPSTPPEMGHFIAQAIPGSRYVELPTAHLSNVEAASQFTDAVSAFLGS